MILNLQTQINALQNNTKQTNSKRVTLQQVTIQGNCRQCNTAKYCWSHGACAQRSENCRNKKMVIKIQQLLQIKWEED